MKGTADCYEELREYVETVPLVDCHDHSGSCGPKYTDPTQVIVNGYFPADLTSTGLLPLHNTPRGGRCHGTNEKPITAVVPAWLKPGKYAPAFGTRSKGVRDTAPPPRTPGTQTPKLTDRTDLPDSRADTDRVRHPGTVSGGAPSLGRRR